MGENEQQVAQQDNTKVSKKLIIKTRFPRRWKFNQERIYDADKAKFYRNKQNMYNSSLFGPSSPTRYDPTTEQGQRAIDAAFEQTSSNAKDLIYNMAGTMLGKPLGILPRGRRIAGRIERLLPYKIGEGSEAMVFDNGMSVLKVGNIPAKEMAKRNSIPNTIPSRYVGRVKTDYAKLPAYTQKKVKILTEETFPKYIQKLDQMMQKSGFRKVNDPNIQYRAYTNGRVVVDDISPDNVGLDWLRRPKMIDFNMQTVPEWLDMGFTLKNGGKL